MLACVFNGEYLAVDGCGERWRLWPDGRCRLEGSRRQAAPDFRLMAVTAETQDPTRALDPRHVDVRGPLPAEAVAAKQAAYAAFRRVLPPELAAILEPFRSHQWRLLELLLSGTSARDLAQSSPVLAYALANHEHIRKGPVAGSVMAHARARLSRRQRDILGWLGFPATEAAAILFRKLPAASVHLAGLRLLRSVLADAQVAQWLAHIRRPNAGVLACMNNRALHAMLTPRLLEDIARRAEDDEAAPAADLLCDLRALWRDVHPDCPMPRPGSLENARRLHDELIVLRNRQMEEQHIAAERRQEARREAERGIRRRRRNRRFHNPGLPIRIPVASPRELPPPPFAGTDFIKPLTTVDELNEEGWIMTNCVASYAERVAAGRTYIYRLLAPQRATVSIYRIGQRWTLDQLRLAHNRAALSQTHRFVLEWLFAVQQESGVSKKDTAGGQGELAMR